MLVAEVFLSIFLNLPNLSINLDVFFADSPLSPGDPRSPCCFASKNSPCRFFGIAVEVALNYSMAPPKDAVDQTIARPPIADGNPYSTPAPWSPAFGFLIVCSTRQNFPNMNSGNQQDNDGVEMCTVVFLEFASFISESVRKSHAFYIFLQESKISKVFRISWCPIFFEDMFPSLESGGQLARSHFRPIPRCGHQARPCWVRAGTEGGNGFDTRQVAQFTLVSWKTKEKL